MATYVATSPSYCPVMPQASPVPPPPPPAEKKQDPMPRLAPRSPLGILGVPREATFKMTELSAIAACLDAYGCAVVKLDAPIPGADVKDVCAVIEGWRCRGAKVSETGAILKEDNLPGSLATGLINGAERLADDGGVVHTGVGQSKPAWAVRAHPAVVKLFSHLHQTNDLRTSMDTMSLFVGGTHVTTPAVSQASNFFDTTADSNRATYIAYYTPLAVKATTGGIVVQPCSHLRHKEVLARLPVRSKAQVLRSPVVSVTPFTHSDDWFMRCDPGSLIIIDKRCVMWHQAAAAAKQENGAILSVMLRVTLEPASWQDPETLEQLDKMRVACYLHNYTTTDCTTDLCIRGAGETKRSAAFHMAPPTLPTPLTKAQRELLASDKVIADHLPPCLCK